MQGRQEKIGTQQGTKLNDRERFEKELENLELLIRDPYYSIDEAIKQVRVTWTYRHDVLQENGNLFIIKGRKCRICKICKDMSQYYKDRKSYRHICKSCHIDLQKKYHPLKQKKTSKAKSTATYNECIDIMEKCL